MRGAAQRNDLSLQMLDWEGNTASSEHLQPEQCSQASPFLLLTCDFFIYPFCDTYAHLASPLNTPVKKCIPIGSLRIGHYQGNDKLTSKNHSKSQYWSLLYHQCDVETQSKDWGLPRAHRVWCNETGWQARASCVTFCCLHRFASLVT